MLFTSVQLEPFQDSVSAVLVVCTPPKAKAEVLDIPEPPKALLAVFKSFTSVQLVPSNDSVKAELGGVVPPKTKPDVCTPAEAKAVLPVFKLLPVDHEPAEVTFAY
jgi:hypothetical protein